MLEITPTSQNIELLEELRVNSVLALNRDNSEDLLIDNVFISEDYLIVLVDIALNEIIIINADTTPKFPIRLNLSFVVQAVAKKNLFITDMAWPRLALRAMDDLSETQSAKAKTRFKDIRALVDNLEAVLRNGYGEKLIEKTINQSGKSKQYIYDCFNGFLRYGQRVPALCLPIGKNIIHIPKAKRDIRVKQGRPNTKIPRGKVLDDYDIKIFNKGKRLYQKKNGPNIKTVYKQLMHKHYYKSRQKYDVKEAIRRGCEFRIKLKDRTERPTISQFYFWLVKEFKGNLPLRDKARQNRIENKKDYAGRTGNANINIIAPGQVFELDETPFDEELVSIFDPTRQTKIGKATLYFVIDRFTKLITGLFITTENPSYKTVRQAIFCAARDKTPWLKEFGFNPQILKWEQRGVPTTLFVDNAEFRNRISEGAVFDLNVMVKFARAGRGDDKPSVEKLFNEFSNYFKGLSNAHQTKSLLDIAKQVARKNAKLTINELYTIAIVYVNYHNNHRRLSKDSRDREIIKSNVPPIPARLWNWGMKYRPGYLIEYPDEELYLKLLPKGTVSIHRHGINLLGTGLWYNSEWILSKGLQEQSQRGRKVIHMDCRYHEDFIDLIYIDTMEGLKPATLDNEHAAYYGLSFYEAKVQQHIESMKSDKYSDIQQEQELGVYDFMDLIFNCADKEKINGPIENISKIKANRKTEALINRFSDTNRFIQTFSHQHMANVNNISMNESNNEEESFETSIYDTFEDEDNE